MRSFFAICSCNCLGRGTTGNWLRWLWVVRHSRRDLLLLDLVLHLSHLLLLLLSHLHLHGVVLLLLDEGLVVHLLLAVALVSLLTHHLLLLLIVSIFFRFRDCIHLMRTNVEVGTL